MTNLLNAFDLRRRHRNPVTAAKLFAGNFCAQFNLSEIADNAE